MALNGERLEYSYAFAEKVEGYDSTPRVLDIIARDSLSARAIILLCDGALPENLNCGGMQVKMIRLFKGQLYSRYQVDPEGRGVYFIPREHGGDDGYFGSVPNLDVPTAVGYRSARLSR